MSVRRLYGASPLHLLAHLAAFALFVWAFSQILGGGYWVNYVAWFVGAAVLHDVVALPIYSTIDRIATGLEGRLPRPGPRGTINYIRAPALISAVLLLVYSPLILGYSARNYRNDTGHPIEHEVRNWLLITAGLFLASAVVFAVNAGRRRWRGHERPSSARA